MAKRPRSEDDLNESHPVQGEGAVVIEVETESVPVTLGSLPSEGEDPQLARVAVDSVAAEDEMYTHPFWALLLRPGIPRCNQAVPGIGPGLGQNRLY